MSGTGILQGIDAITQFVGGTEAVWNSTTSPVPKGLVVYAPDTTSVKIGDGTTLYSNLPTTVLISDLLKLGQPRPGYILTEWPSGAVVENGSVYLVYRAPVSGTLNSMDLLCATGSFAVTANINGVAVTGLTATAGSTAQNIAATAANIFAAGDTITISIANATGNPTNAVININLSWNQS